MKFTVYIIFFILLFNFSTVSAQDTFEDNFNSVSYTNNNGSNNFSSNWIENGDDNDAGRGSIRVNNSSLRFRELDGGFIYRFVPLSGYTSVTLTLDYNATNSGGESLGVYIYNSDTQVWNLIEDIDNSNSGSITYTLTAAEIASNPAIIFSSTSGNNWGRNDQIFIDNVLFTAISGPSIRIEDVSISEGGGSAVFTVTHTGVNTVGPFTVNYNSVNGSATSGSDYVVSSGVLVFNGTVGDTETITVPIIDDTDIEGSEDFTIEFTTSSNALVDISDTATGTIEDNDIFIISNGDTVTTCSGLFVDSGSTTGNYSGNEDITYTICPEATESNISVDFSSFDVQDGRDYLYIYDGDSTGATLLGIYDNGNVPSTITASNTSGCLTFRFTSNNRTNESGWEATISCVVKGPIIVVDDVSVNEEDGNAVFTVTHTNYDATTPFTVDYTTADDSATSGSDYTATSGTLTFNGSVGDTETITVPILEDDIIETVDTFLIQFTSTTDSNTDISDTATGSIIDNDGIIMTDGESVNTCNDTFLDSGGLTNYSNNEDVTYTICPDTTDNYISIDFTSFDIANGDLLYIYDGTSTSDDLIGQYNNNNVPSVIESEGTSGCLTFRFVSNNNTTGEGWIAEINCYPEGPKIVIEDISFDETVGNAVFTVTQTRAEHGTDVFLLGFINTDFTVDFTTVDGTAEAGSDYTAVSGTLTFNGEIGDVQTISVPITNDGLPEIGEDFTIEFTSADADYATINYSDTGTGTINSQILANDPLTLFEEFDGYYDYTTTGGSLRTNDNFTDACSITDSSSNSLIASIPATATIEKAYLYWAHSGEDTDVSVIFEGETVTANYIYQTVLTNRNFYGYVSDVTSIVESINDPSTNVYDFSGLTIDNTGNYCSTQTVLGGWTLMVFYEDLSLPAVNINLYQGFDGLSNDGTSFTLDSFFAIAGSGAKASFLSWEGDSTLDGSSSGSTNPEELSITNQAGVTNILAGDGGQTGNNVYNSTIYDNTVTPEYNITTSYGVDLDTYDISTFISPADTQVTANVDVGQDFAISAAVVIKVPSNLIAGNVFEDVNYPGGVGRDENVAGVIGVSGATVELFDASGNFIQRNSTEIDGDYSFGGMADGDYNIKVVNSTVKSNRGGGLNCSDCYPIQTYRSYGASGSLVDVIDEVGGADPTATQDVALGVINNAQSVSAVTVSGNGVVGIDFGFNFNTIVNTNEDGQGSLEQFIVNANNLDETDLDIESNAIFDPASGEDTSIFMIPSSSDPLGRTADSNFTNGYFNIEISNSESLSVITDSNTHIDGRTQTAYSGDTNTGIVVAGSTVGTTAVALSDIDNPEIQIYRQNGDVLENQGDNVVVRNLSIFANNNSIIKNSLGSITITNNLIGTNAEGIVTNNAGVGVEVTGGNTIIESNYFEGNDDSGILVNGGDATLIQNNYLTDNGTAACSDNITLEAGTGIEISQNFITNSGSIGIDGDAIAGSVIISENTITNSGQNGGNCQGNIENFGIRLSGDNSSMINNIIASNGGAGIVLSGASSTGNLISQNSIYANGTSGDALGIDLDASDNIGDGVTLNDSADGDSGVNELLNFPVIAAAYISGSNIVVEGWARPGATIELFLTDINEGTATEGDNQIGKVTDYGEGQTYIATVTEGSSDDLFSNTSSYSDLDGNTDNTNKFKFIIAKPSTLVVGNYITSTATISNSTSEFSPFSILKNYTVITNRRITYRVKSN